jgi:hypothetical protein
MPQSEEEGDEEEVEKTEDEDDRNEEEEAIGEEDEEEAIGEEDEDDEEGQPQRNITKMRDGKEKKYRLLKTVKSMEELDKFRFKVRP